MDVLELGLAGKVAIVTGGSEGLGRACVERFAKSGAKIAVCARRKDVLERAVDAIEKTTGADILAMATDVTNGPQVEAFVAATTPSGTGVQLSLFGLTGVAVGWEEGIEVNLLTLNFGVELKHPALKLPMVGRIGPS